MDVLTSLAGRRGALEDRQKELDLKANVLAAAEKRVDEKIAQLKALQTQIESLMGQRDAKETQQTRRPRPGLFGDEAEGCRAHLRLARRRRAHQCRRPHEGRRDGGHSGRPSLRCGAAAHGRTRHALQRAPRPRAATASARSAACATRCTAGSADALRHTRDAKPHPRILSHRALRSRWRRCRRSRSANPRATALPSTPRPATRAFSSPSRSRRRSKHRSPTAF